MELSHPPWLTLGSVTLLGQAAPVFGSHFTSMLAVAAGMAGAWGIASALAGGFLGTNFDSLLGGGDLPGEGASQQQRGRPRGDALRGGGGGGGMDGGGVISGSGIF